MEKTVFDTQEIVRDIQENEGKRFELLKDVVMYNPVVIAIDEADIKKVLDCDGQMVISKAEADNLETALKQVFANASIEKEVLKKAKRMLFAITTRKDHPLKMDDMDYVRQFLDIFKESKFNTWAIYTNAYQVRNVSVILWAVGISKVEGDS